MRYQIKNEKGDRDMNIFDYFITKLSELVQAIKNNLMSEFGNTHYSQ